MVNVAGVLPPDTEFSFPLGALAKWFADPLQEFFYAFVLGRKLRLGNPRLGPFCAHVVTCKAVAKLAQINAQPSLQAFLMS